MNIKTWFIKRNFLTKVLLIYVIFMVVPMFSVTLYNYINTKNILLERSYDDIRENAEALENSFQSLFQTYDTMIAELRADKALNTYLSLDYTNRSYDDIAYYSQTTLDNLMVLYPEIEWIHFYSDNATLPQDQYYFYPASKMEADVLEEADAAMGEPVASGHLLRRGGKEIVYIANMNYFMSKYIHNYVAIGIRQDAVTQPLQLERQGSEVYLLDESGTILSASSEKTTGWDFSNVIADWPQMKSGEILTRRAQEGGELLCLKKDVGAGMTLVLTMDQGMLLREINRTPMIAAGVFLLISAASFLFVWLLNRALSERLQQIVYATERIGHGNFDYVLKDTGEDEFGRIAGAINQMRSQIKRLIHDNYERQLRLKTSEMNLLQEQINPHFLYNALAVISSLSMREGGRQTVQSVRYLADFYRASLSRGRQVITVEEELTILKSYMKIQMLRFSDQLAISYEIDPAILKCRTIKLIVQPLVENAIHHGRREEQVLHIRVLGGSDGGRVYFEVRDDGAGMAPEQLEKLRQELRTQQEGFGLKNVDIRIKLHYGSKYGVRIESKLGRGTQVHVEIPKRTE